LATKTLSRGFVLSQSTFNLVGNGTAIGLGRAGPGLRISARAGNQHAHNKPIVHTVWTLGSYYSTPYRAR